MAGAVGIEPTSKVLETSILPLNYAPVKWWWGTDSNRRTLRERIYSPPRLATSLPHRNSWCRRKDLNPQPTDYKSVALPIELHRHIKLERWLRTESNRRHKDFQSFALPTELLSHISICWIKKWRSRPGSNRRSPA